jgi:hypothetical protein
MGSCRASLLDIEYHGRRRDGGWSWPLAHGPLVELVGQFVGKVGTDAFFDLM